MSGKKRKKKQSIPKRAKIVLGIVAVAFAMWIGLLAVIFAPKREKRPEAGKRRVMETATLYRITKVCEELNGKTFDSVVTEYDDFGRLVKVMYYDDDGNGCGHGEVRYNEEGRLSSVTEYEEDGSPADEYKYVYMDYSDGNEGGPVAVCMKYNASGRKVWAKKYALNGVRRLIRYSVYEDDGTIENEYRTYHYDDAGHLTNMAHLVMVGRGYRTTDVISYYYYDDGMPRSILYANWFYDGEDDQKGKRVETSQTNFNRGSDNRYTEIREIDKRTGKETAIPCTYDENGNLISPIIIDKQIESVGVSVKNGTATYDEQHRQRVWISGTPDTTQVRYEFDERGEMVTHLIIGKHGVVSKLTYVYEELTVSKKALEYADEIWFLINSTEVE